MRKKLSLKLSQRLSQHWSGPVSVATFASWCIVQFVANYLMPQNSIWNLWHIIWMQIAFWQRRTLQKIASSSGNLHGLLSSRWKNCLCARRKTISFRRERDWEIAAHSFLQLEKRLRSLFYHHHWLGEIFWLRWMMMIDLLLCEVPSKQS